MITFPSKYKLKNSSYSLALICFLNHKQKYLLGKLLIFIIGALMIGCLYCSLHLFGFIWKQEEVVAEVGLISTETKRQQVSELPGL